MQALPPSVAALGPFPLTASVASKASSKDLLQLAAPAGFNEQDRVLMAACFGGGLLNVAGAGTGASIMAHELGHAVAAEALFVGANPHISIQPFKGGVTSFRAGALTALGEKYGREMSLGITSGAGPLVDTAISMVSFAAGFAVRKEHPYIGGALMGNAGLTMLNDTLYAGSALFGSVAELARAGNDFAGLAVYLGIPPLVSVAIMAAALPAEYLLLKGVEKLVGKLREG